MIIDNVLSTAKAMVADHKGILAIDESPISCNKRFAEVGIPQTECFRKDYRELIITTPHLSNYISSVILCDETTKEERQDGTSFIKYIIDSGIIPGVKVDRGERELAGYNGEKITEGIDGLRERLAIYAQKGIRFAKWRAEIIIGNSIPTSGCIDANAHLLARYAALCQEAGLVPIVEPEVTMNGHHTLERCKKVTAEVLHSVFNQLYRQKVVLEGIILKPNMVISGLECSVQASINEVADATINCLLQSVPAAVAGIAFLSGGQSCQLASANLNAMNKKYKSKLPWPLTFSYARAIQQPAIEIWQGKKLNIEEAQAELLHRAQCNYSARRGEYDKHSDKY